MKTKSLSLFANKTVILIRHVSWRRRISKMRSFPFAPLRVRMTEIFLASLIFSIPVQPAYAAGGKEAAASFFLPTTGQAMNGELGQTKTKIMGGVEFAAVTTTTLIGLSTGGAAVLLGAIPLAANHLWSSVDAYRSAQGKSQYGPSHSIAYQQMIESEKAMEMNRGERFTQEEGYRSDFRERMRRAGEPAY